MSGTWIGLPDEAITPTLEGILALVTSWAVAADDDDDYAIAQPLDKVSGHLERAISRMREVDMEMAERAAVAAVIDSLSEARARR